ncbi:MAG: patatin-like phospholipase family protein [Vicingaceae bacterium]
MINWKELIGVEEKTGLSLSGGAVYGAAHIGVIQALEEFDIKINSVAGTSIGAFVGALYAFGMKSDEMKEALADIDWFDISSISLSKFGLLSNRKMGKFIEKHIGKAHFEDAKISLDIIATDITTGQAVVLNQGSVVDAVIASASIPGIFNPIEKDGMLLCDGGMVENLPISPLKARKLDRIIAVDLNSKIHAKRPENIIELLMNAFHYTLMNSTKHVAPEADLLIQPDLSAFNRYDTKQTKELIAKGYETTISALK